MEKFKNAIKVILIMVLMLPIFVINVNAEDGVDTDSLFRTCRYIRNSKTVYVQIEVQALGESKKEPKILSNDGNVIGYLSYAESNVSLEYGCAPYLYYSGSQYTFSSKILSGFLGIGTNNNYYEYNGIISSNKINDIYNEGAYNDDYYNSGDLNGEQLNDAKNKEISCKYIVDKKSVSIVMYASSGTINVIPVNTNIENPNVLLSTLENNRTCPATICYKENSSRSSKNLIYFSKDKDYSCPSGYSKNEKRNQDELEEDILDRYITSEERSQFEKQINNVYDNSVNDVISCLYNNVDIDSPKKCILKYMSYETKCKNGAVNDECKQAMIDYVDCVKRDYSVASQTKCSVQINKMELDFKNLPKDALNDYVLNNKVAIAVKDLTKEYNNDYVPCTDLLGEDVVDFLSEIYFYIEMFSVILVIILGIVDFMKAAASDEADSNKKAFKAFTRRLIALAILILLPFILEFLLGIFEMNGVESTNPLCEVVK